MIHHVGQVRKTWSRNLNVSIFYETPDCFLIYGDLNWQAEWKIKQNLQNVPTQMHELIIVKLFLETHYDIIGIADYLYSQRFHRGISNLYQRLFNPNKLTRT